MKISTTAFVSEERTGFYFISGNSRQAFAFDSRVWLILYFKRLQGNSEWQFESRIESNADMNLFKKIYM
jgi:hypothetical protein